MFRRISINSCTIVCFNNDDLNFSSKLSLLYDFTLFALIVKKKKKFDLNSRRVHVNVGLVRQWPLTNYETLLILHMNTFAPCIVSYPQWVDCLFISFVLEHSGIDLDEILVKKTVLPWIYGASHHHDCPFLAQHLKSIHLCALAV